MSLTEWALGLGALGVAVFLGYTAVNNLTSQQGKTTTTSCPVNLFGVCLGQTTTTGAANNPANPNGGSPVAPTPSPVTAQGQGTLAGNFNTVCSAVTLNPAFMAFSPVCSLGSAALSQLGW